MYVNENERFIDFEKKSRLTSSEHVREMSCVLQRRVNKWCIKPCNQHIKCHMAFVMFILSTSIAAYKSSNNGK